jgi:hypothetical protein
LNVLREKRRRGEGGGGEEIPSICRNDKNIYRARS